MKFTSSIQMEAPADKDWEKECPRRTYAIRVLAITELIDKARQEGVNRIFYRRRPQLFWLRCIGFVVVSLRLAAFLALVVFLFGLRFQVMESIGSLLKPSERVDTFHSMITDVLSVCFFLVLFISFLQLLVCFLFYTQHSISIALLYACDFVIVMFVLLVVAGMSCFPAHRMAMTSSLLGGAMQKGDPKSRPIEVLQKDYDCCGFNHAGDHVSRVFYTYVDFLTGSERNLLADPTYFNSACHQKYKATNSYVCSLPAVCCYQTTMTLSKNEIIPCKMNFTLKPGESIDRNDVSFDQFEPPVEKIGCVQALLESMDKKVFGIQIAASCVGFLTFIITMLVIILLIYHGGWGEICQNPDTVRPPTRNPMVQFFMQLDGQHTDKDDEDNDITDFSIIEYAKNFDVDKQIEDDQSDIEEDVF